VARHSRADIRFHRNRVIKKRKTQAYRVLSGRGDLERLDARPAGELVNEQAWIGCRRAHCGICHPTKRWHRGGDRQREKRSWQRDWLTA
jgi:hypothetical protein